MSDEPGVAPAWMRPPAPRWSDPPGAPGRALRSRRTLVRSAARLIDRHGYHAASTRDILADAGLTKGALYFHFRSKHELVRGLVDEVVASWVALTAEIAARELDPLWRLLVETDTTVARMMSDPLVRGASRAVRESEEFADDCGRWMASWHDTTLHRFTDAAAAGLLNPTVAPARVTRLLQATVTGHHTLAELTPGPSDQWERMSDVWQALLPIVAVPAWADAWAASAWASRPMPDPAVYLAAAEPHAAGPAAAGPAAAVTPTPARG